jgi:hypothetical protein
LKAAKQRRTPNFTGIDTPHYSLVFWSVLALRRFETSRCSKRRLKKTPQTVSRLGRCLPVYRRRSYLVEGKHFKQIVFAVFAG